MLFRCSIPDPDASPSPKPGDWTPLRQSVVLANFFATRGYRIAFAVNRSQHDMARRLLGKEATIYRVPNDPEHELKRLAHLRRLHKHNICIVNRPGCDSAYLFGIYRQFPFSAVVDHGSRFLVYAHMIINPDVSAPSLGYSCSPSAKLLLGPKFHIAPEVAAPTCPAPPSVPHLLIWVGNDESVIFKLLSALNRMTAPPAITLCYRRDADLRRRLAAFTVGHPRLDINALLFEPDAHPTWEAFTAVVVDPDGPYLDLAQRGIFFVTAAPTAAQLQPCYILEQLGVSPTLGWPNSRSDQQIAGQLERLLGDQILRRRYSTMGPQLVDGKGLSRIAHFIPREDELGKPTVLQPDKTPETE